MIYETTTYTKLKNKPQDNFVTKIFVHHTGGTSNPKNDSADTSHHTAQIVEAGHISKGWEGIGYHEFIEKDGDVWLGRPAHYHGAHVKEDGWNSESYSICLAGNFDAFLPVPEQEKVLAERLKLALERFKLTEADIVPHRSVLGNPPYKQCYGKKLAESWARDLLKTVPEIPVAPQVDKAKIQQAIDILKTLV